MAGRDDDQMMAARVENDAAGRGGLSQAELDALVASSDTGGRSPGKAVATFLMITAVCWSLFQLWIASPIPFIVRWGVFNDTEARSIHLAFALFLAYAAYPASRTKFQLGLAVAVPVVLAALFMIGAKADTSTWWIPIIAAAVVVAILLGSPKDRIPPWEWAMGIIAAGTSLYLYFFYNDISSRVGAPILQDMVVGVLGLMLLLEATRRALGPALMIVASVFLIYTFLGPNMPSIIAHKGNSLSEVINHQWITTEGVFGIALGVSTSFVFLFVLFGALLDKAGAGNYFIQVAFSLMGHMRGGPAKAAVVSSAMTGLISGSSIANVVTTGTFTIPLMKKVGFSSEKAGAVEVASSVNGQIMPPVMGAAAFLMVEYVGIPYFDVVKHAFVPAVISYIALVYIVHLEAVKAGMEGLPRAYVPKPIIQRLIGIAFTIGVICALSFAVYYGMGWIRPAFPESAGYIIFALITAAYVALLYVASKEPPLKLDDPNAPVTHLPLPGPTVRSGLHFLLPVVVLVWALMVDRLSPGLSAFWATAFMIFILVTQRPLMAMFRGESRFANDVAQGFRDLVSGLEIGARNMIGIGIATATAGIIVGAVSQTGVGSALADVVEVLSGGNILAILFLTAILSLILGMGLPTTANYIVVSALLAPVIVTLGTAERADRAADRGASFRVLFRDHGGRDATGGPREFRGGRRFRRRSDQDRRGGVLLFAADGGAAVPVHFQHRSAADRRGLDPRDLGLHHRDRRDAAFRGGDAGVVPDEEPVLRERRPASDRVLAVPSRFLDGHDLAALSRSRAGGDRRCGDGDARRGRSAHPGRGGQRSGRSDRVRGAGADRRGRHGRGAPGRRGHLPAAGRRGDDHRRCRVRFAGAGRGARLGPGGAAGSAADAAAEQVSDVHSGAGAAGACRLSPAAARARAGPARGGLIAGRD